jgi:hypothetical protein
MIKPFKDTQIYTPKQLGETKFFSKAKKHRERQAAVLRLIREGKLKAKNIQTKQSPRYVIEGLSANDYLTK